jgi:hypothetical protein
MGVIVEGLEPSGSRADFTARRDRMPRYLFVLRHPDHETPDNEPVGMDLSDDNTAREFALKIIRGLVQDEDEKWEGWVMVVTQNGRQVWRLPFEPIEPIEPSLH